MQHRRCQELRRNGSKDDIVLCDRDARNSKSVTRLWGERTDGGGSMVEEESCSYTTGMLVAEGCGNKGKIGRCEMLIT